MLINRTSSSCGAFVTGINLEEGFSNKQIISLINAIYEHKCLVIKNQDFSHEGYKKFGSEWGILIRHMLDYLRTPSFPELMVIGNTEKKDKDEAIRNGAAVWHSDGTYIKDSTTITMLHAKEVPENGGETLIADLVSAYEDLDPILKKEIENLKALHFYGKAEFDKDEHVPAPIRTKKQKEANPICEKPLVMKHPYSGKKSLYGITHSPFRIIGKSEAQTKNILKTLKDFATQEKYIYRHKYEVGDVLLFDNLTTMHRAKARIEFVNKARTNSRLLWRLSCKGKPRLIN
jgi:taurine dioxygenase